MRALSLPLSAVVAGLLAAALVAVGCQTTATAVSPTARGEKFFKTKCNACHPGGGQGAGPPIDVTVAATFLERGKTSGRHGVPEAEWNALLAYMGERFGAPGMAAGVTPDAALAAAPAALAAQVLPTAAAPTIPAGTDPARGGRWFDAKCNKCHPNGGRGVGPAIVATKLPGPLKSAGTGGRHDVPPEEYEHLLAHLAVRVGGAIVGLSAPSAPAARAPAAVPVAVPAIGGPASGAPAAVPAGASVDAIAGAAYFQAKCNKCHMGGRNIAGRTLPGALQVDGSGKHGVPSAVFENLLAHLVTLGAVRGAPAAPPTAAAATITPVPAPVAPPPPPLPTTTRIAPGPIPANAGMVPCTCNCQCPPGAPAAAIPAACICQCACPR